MSTRESKNLLRQLRDELARAEQSRLASEEIHAKLLALYASAAEKATQATEQDDVIERLLEIEELPERFFPEDLACVGHLYDHLGHLEKFLERADALPRARRTEKTGRAVGMLRDYYERHRQAIGPGNFATLQEFDGLRARFKDFDFDEYFATAAQELERARQKISTARGFRMGFPPSAPFALYLRLTSVTRQGWLCILFGIYALVEASFLRKNPVPLQVWSAIYGSQLFAWGMVKFLDGYLVGRLFGGMRNAFRMDEMQDLLSKSRKSDGDALSVSEIDAFNSAAKRAQAERQAYWSRELTELPKIVERIRAGAALRKAPTSSLQPRTKIAGGSR